jgi:hypothetical protein
MLVTITILPQNAGTEAVIERDLLAARELRLNGTSGLGAWVRTGQPVDDDQRRRFCIGDGIPLGPTG